MIQVVHPESGSLPIPDLGVEKALVEKETKRWIFFYEVNLSTNFLMFYFIVNKVNKHY